MVLLRLAGQTKKKGMKSQRNKATNINHVFVSAVKVQIDGAFIAALF